MVSADGTHTSVHIDILGTNDAAILSSATVNLTETNTAAAIDPRHADHQRRRQPGDLRGAGGTAGTYGTFSDRHQWRLDLHRKLGARRVRGRQHYTENFDVVSADGTHTSVHGQYPRHQ